MNRNISLAIAAIALLTGCAPKNDGVPVKPTAAMLNQSITDTQKQIQTVQDNPSIPDATKQAIVARLQGNIDRTKGMMSTPSAH